MIDGSRQLADIRLTVRGESEHLRQLRWIRNDQDGRDRMLVVGVTSRIPASALLVLAGV